ncbi:MAG: GYD domain-containing protein [Burkholderiales bacterium]
MGKYVVLGNWTDQGVKNVKDTVIRARAARQGFEKMGVKWDQILWTVGPYDLMVIVDAPNDESATKAGLMVGMQGNIRTTTMRAFGEAEMEGIIKGLG